jgi:serine/threonine protein kinase
MGTVYLAHDPKLHRLVAIKLLNDNFRDDEELLQRFMREARVAGGLRHPHIVVVFDVEDDEGRPFITMEYVEGATLDRVMRRVPPLALRTRIELMEDLCSALAHAHAAGLVHRDIKPANVMVDESGVLKILDFGIARIANSGLTREGVMIGSVNYMSPEQVVGPQVDHRSDIFAVGAVLYEVVALERAFPGDTDTAVLRSILYDGAVPIERRIPDIDPELAAIIRRALQREPADRYQSVDDMREDLARVRERLTHGAGQFAPTLIREAPPKVRRSRRGHWAAAAAALAIMAGAIWWSAIELRSVPLPPVPRAEIPVPNQRHNPPPPRELKPSAPTSPPRQPTRNANPAREDPVADLLAKAREALHGGRDREALPTTAEALRLRPGDAEALELLTEMAENAREAALAARGDAERAGAMQLAPGTFGQGESQLRSGEVERGARRFDRALPAFWNARDRFGAAAGEAQSAPVEYTPTPPTTTPLAEADAPKPPPVARTADPQADEREAIRRTLRAYEDAWRARDILALRHVQQLSPAELETVEQSMRDAREFELRVRVHSAAVDAAGGRATLSTTIHRRFVPRQGPRREVPRDTIVVLEKRQNRWIIVDLK